jgi:hypothetical protein
MDIGGDAKHGFFDRQAGLQYNYFRDDDPALGRYVESDPLVSGQPEIVKVLNGPDANRTFAG